MFAKYLFVLLNSLSKVLRFCGSRKILEFKSQSGQRRAADRCDHLTPSGSNIARAIATASTPNRLVQVSSRRPDRVYRSLLDALPADAQRRLLPPKVVDVTEPSTLASAFQNANVVVSLVGIMHGSPADFERIQWRGAENVALAARETGAKLIHISAIGADENSSIPYERTKALGEKAVFAACPNATIIRPSLVFGPGDDFFTVRCLNIKSLLPVIYQIYRDLQNFLEHSPLCRSSAVALRSFSPSTSVTLLQWWKYCPGTIQKLMGKSTERLLKLGALMVCLYF